MAAATQPPDETMSKQLSFVQTLAGQKPNPRNLFEAAGITRNASSVINSQPSMVKGELAFLLTKEDEQLAAPFKFVLIRKFSKGRPSMDYLWNKFQRIGFKGGFSLGIIDRRHILILFDLEEDLIQRVCVEVDLLHELPSRIRLGTEEHSYFQPITYENLPDYCLKCRKIGHDAKDCRHGKQKSENVERQPQKQTSVTKVKPQAQMVAPAWKQKPMQNQNQEEIEKEKGASTSGLTEKEKKDIPMDVPSTVSPQQQNSSAKRRFTKEQLNIVLEKNKMEENIADPWEEEVPINKKNREQQLVLYQDPEKIIKLSDRFQVLSELHDDDEFSEMEENRDEEQIHHDSDGSHSDTEEAYSELQCDTYGKTVETSAVDDMAIVKLTTVPEMEDARLVVSDGEEKKKKPGRPKGSTKSVKQASSKTLSSARLSGDLSSKISE
ncbi:OLC1v1001505C1 [Oldenlandia corymbosa var. corymbosa]|uniref:OLC1v1001505C1 n=1 Tax=Oldenlandia corymbosa var. corymbosa TaxID=529605 RepID=A0AAV1D645_OLDCO|nr:OLC1v1001505C1 [Oldenlandia corymbosa var. corymbosa]